jgi:hypothetical protein
MSAWKAVKLIRDGRHATIVAELRERIEHLEATQRTQGETITTILNILDGMPRSHRPED